MDTLASYQKCLKVFLAGAAAVDFSASWIDLPTRQARVHRLGWWQRSDKQSATMVLIVACNMPTDIWRLTTVDLQLLPQQWQLLPSHTHAHTHARYSATTWRLARTHTPPPPATPTPLSINTTCHSTRCLHSPPIYVWHYNWNYYQLYIHICIYMYLFFYSTINMCLPHDFHWHATADERVRLWFIAFSSVYVFVCILHIYAYIPYAKAL